MTLYVSGPRGIFSPIEYSSLGAKSLPPPHPPNSKDVARTEMMYVKNRTRLHMWTITQSIWKTGQRQIRVFICLAALCGIATAFQGRLAAQTEHPLTGRKIAGVMGVGGAD